MAQDLNRSIKVYIDNSDAMAKAQELESRISKLRGELEKLNAQGKKDSQRYKETEKQLREANGLIGAARNKVQEMERTLKNLSGATYKELLSAKKILRAELKEETRGTERYTAILKQYHAVQKEITLAQKEMNNQLGAQGTFMSRAANGFNKYFGMVTSGIAAVTGISLTLRKLSQDAAAMEDVYADVMKTTGMTRDEVGDLNEEFKKMDTRTSREQLNMLARDAGKLGLSAKKDVLDFVEAGNQINVALGEDLGEGAIKSIGKMADVYSRSTKEIESQDLKGKMLAVGSAINELAQNSTASEPYLVAFAGRLGGVAAQAGIGIDKILGFASALDQDMQAVEMSATALQKFIMTLMAKPAEFAKYAKMEVGEFSELLRTDANEAIKAVLRTMNEKGGLQQLIPMFQEMGLDGARAVGVLSSMASSIDKIDTAQDLANKSMREGISTTNEYNVKNENAAAELEKRRKAFKDAAEELGRRLNPALLKSTNYVTYLVKLLPGLLDFLEKYGKYILYLGTVYAVYTAAVKLHTKWQAISHGMSLKELALYYKSEIALKRKTAAIYLSRIAMLAYNVALGLVTGNLTMMRRAWILLTKAMSASPIGVVVASLTALAGAFILVRNNMQRVRSEKQALDGITKDVAKSTAEERSELERLLGVAKNERISKEERLKAIKKLNEISPEYLGNLSLENINTDAARKSVEQYTEALKKNARQKAIGDKMSELFSQRDEKEIKRAEHESILESRRASEIGQSDIDRSHQNAINEIDREIESINKAINAYQNLGESMLEETEAEKEAAKKLESWRENTHKMGKVQLEKWIEINKDAADEYLKIAQEVYKNRFVSNTEDENPNPNPTATTPADDKKIYQEKLAKLESYIAQEKGILQNSYIHGKISREDYNRQLEFLELERLRRNAELAGLTDEQQLQIEQKLFEAKQQMLMKIRDEEVAHQKKMAEIQREAEEARAANNLVILKNIAKQNEDNYKKEFERESKRREELTSMATDFGDQIGNLLGSSIAGNTNLVASSLKSIINMSLDALEAQVQVAIAATTAQSIASSGFAGIAKAALLAGLIKVAFSTAKSLVGSIIDNKFKTTSGGDLSTSSGSGTGARVATQRAAGKYDVIGADDGRQYRNVPYVGPAQTGFVSSPTLMGEQGRELVVSAPDLSRLQRHINYPLIIRAIHDARSGVVPQRASGNYDNIPSGTPEAATSYDPRIMTEIRDLLLFLKTNPLKAYVLLSEMHAKQELLNKSQNIGKK